MRSLDIPLDEHGRREWIKYQLRLQGYTFGALAREHGLSRSAIRNALWGPSPRYEGIIAEKLDLIPEQIWPERYEGREPCRAMGRPPKDAHEHKHTKPAGGGNGKRREVA